jgi:hypothetical protein
MSDPTIDEALMTAVEDHDVMRVKTTLAEGANPNYVKTWEGDTTYQPNTPLRMVVFRISDNLLEARDLNKFSELPPFCCSTVLIQSLPFTWLNFDMGNTTRMPFPIHLIMSCVSFGKLLNKSPVRIKFFG